jgi:predicted membrane-bound mannosyltransferase/sugar lactone lactonase YvrE
LFEGKTMEAIQETSSAEKHSWLDRPLIGTITINWETILFTAIVFLAVVSRFYDLGTRVMSHDETSHVYFSWQLEQGRGYKHDPITHGPLQFHLIALSYFLFGDSDFSGRFPAAVFSIATVAFLWFYRRYLGRAGALIAAGLMLISPYILYYGRYARNEALVGLFGVILLWGMLRYFETGAPRYLLWIVASTVFHFTSKETAYIYTAQALIFLAIFFVGQVIRSPWSKSAYRAWFLVALLVTILLVGAAGFLFLGGESQSLSPTETSEPSVPGEALPAASPGSLPVLALVGLGMVALLVAAYFLISGYGLDRIRRERSFDMLIVLGTLVLPMLAPFPVKLLGWDPLDYSMTGMLRTGMFLAPLTAIAIGVGIWWNARLWLTYAAFFYAVYVIFFTTIFTNGSGFFTGIVGSLGYWLEQQGVERGNQPWYYYIFLQIPIYEYLPALGSLLAIVLALFGRRPKPGEADDLEADEGVHLGTESEASQRPALQGPTLAIRLFGYWILTSILAYTYAGEKMPWLTFHIALPMILAAGWGLGYLVETTRWSELKARRGLLVIAVLAVFITSLAAVLGSLLGANPPFAGQELPQLQATTTFLTALLVTVASGTGLVYLLRAWSFAQFIRLAGVAVFGLSAFLTVRTAIQATYINYDFATEYLVYAHTGPGAKEILNQIEQISLRTTDGLALEVAYDNETTYPFWWYLRNYHNARYFGANPTRDLRESPIILVGEGNYGKIEPIVGQAFHRFEYIRMWWPMQDYYELTLARIWNAIADPHWRSAVFQIWFNRDYSQYASLVDRDMSLPRWQPSQKMRMYIRKDAAAQVWNYGVGPVAEEIIADPYEGKEADLSADIVLGSPGSAPGQFNRPRDLVVAPDGSLYVADTDNHRIQHLARDGSLIHSWGSFADISQGPAPGGTFYEPWGVAQGPDGSIYVTDTWNHRIQKFTPEGEFLTMWGFFGQAESPTAFWGPRDVVVDAEGRVHLTDTGNKRVVIFDAEGNYLNQFGSEGFDPGQFSEPVGLALDGEGRLYVADTWNQRIQQFTPNGAGGYLPENVWDIYGWFGESLDNKPFLAADDQGHVFVTDPEGYRVLEFDPQGQIVRFWGDYSLGVDGFGMAGGVAVDPGGGVWVSDTGNNRLMHFSLPEE